jgi:superfamily II DNA or RNA helicase
MAEISDAHAAAEPLKEPTMPIPSTIAEYLRRSSQELGERILKIYPALQAPDDPVSERFNGLLRSPFAAQRLAVMGVVKRWEQARAAAVIAECGTGKTLMALSALHVHSAGRPYAALVMAPPNIVGKWCREILITISGARVFIIDGLRTPTRSGTGPYGVNEVRYRNGRIVREGLHTTLTDLRLRKSSKSARDCWQKLCPGPSFWVVGRDRAKLSYFWRHAYSVAESGPYLGSAVNADSGAPLIVNDERVLATEFEKIRRSEILGGPDGGSGKDRRSIYSPLWQADGKRIRRFAPLEFVGRYMKGFFDYGIADEVHELSNDTAQGNALGTLARAVDKIAVLTGTLMGGYADDLFNVLYRLEPHKMVAEGYEWGEPGVRSFAETYGVLERVTIIAPEENACSKAKVTKQVKRKPGASPLLFGKFLMELGAFVSLEDISSELPSYREEVIGVDMDEPLAKAYTDLEEQIKEALEEHRGNHSVISTALNALLSYPDRPYGMGDLIGTEYDPELHGRVPFLIAKTQDLAEDLHYAKERKLIECIKADLARGRKCQIYAVYTAKRDVTSRLERVLSQEGIRVSVLTSQVPPDQREAWYERKLREGMQVCVAHPRLVSVGMDLLWAPSIYFLQTGYSIYTLRQASRRSWRIGQRSNVVVRFLTYNDTMQTSCLRLMGKKLLVSLAMEGKFSNEGLQGIEDDDDVLTAMARELVTEKGVGESAASVWKAVQEQHSRLLPDSPAFEEESAEEFAASPHNGLVTFATTPKDLIFGTRLEKETTRRRPPVVESDSQLSLF